MSDTTKAIKLSQDIIKLIKESTNDPVEAMLAAYFAHFTLSSAMASEANSEFDLRKWLGGTKN